jgi:hypothetical protein
MKRFEYAGEEIKQLNLPLSSISMITSDSANGAEYTKIFPNQLFRMLSIVYAFEQRVAARDTMSIMKPPPDTPEFAKFTNAMRGILAVSKTELQKRIAAEKREKRSTSSASRDSASSSKKVR